MGGILYDAAAGLLRPRTLVCLRPAPPTHAAEGVGWESGGVWTIKGARENIHLNRYSLGCIFGDTATVRVRSEFKQLQL